MRVKLQDPPFRVLALLVERPGEIVTREEIKDTESDLEWLDLTATHGFSANEVLGGTGGFVPATLNPWPWRCRS